MIRPIVKNKIPPELSPCLSAAGRKCWVEIRPEDRVYTHCPETEYGECADVFQEGDSLYLAIYNEKSPEGALLARALWFGKEARVLLMGGGACFRLTLQADRCHISGGIFEKELVALRAQGRAADMGAVFEMTFLGAEPLPGKPEGRYRKEEMTMFEMHLDNPRLHGEGAGPVTGCRFSLAPMSDAFIDIILSSIAKVDTSRVWSMTDEFSTVYRGRLIHVMDALKACFLHSYRKGVHMTLNALLTKGCPGDAEKDARLEDAVWSPEDTLPNEAALADIHFPAAAKFELYPLGEGDYLEKIQEIIGLAKEMGIYDRTAYYVTVVKGDVQELFRYFSLAAARCEAAMEHYAMEITFAVNFPEEEA